MNADQRSMTSSRQGVHAQCIQPTVINTPAAVVLRVHQRALIFFFFYLMVIILSPFLSFCLSTSMCAPVTSWMAVMLQPPRPMIRDTTEAGTDSFFDLEKKQGNVITDASATLTFRPMTHHHVFSLQQETKTF